MKKRRIYDLSDYDITRDGQVINRHNGHISIPQLNNKGYGRVYIGKNLKFVHRLVAEKYVPNPYGKLQVNHIDGNKLNNCADNLEWVSNQENRDHALAHDLHLTGERCPWHKLTKANVDYIRSHVEEGTLSLSEKFGVSPSTIADVWKRRTWKD